MWAQAISEGAAGWWSSDLVKAVGLCALVIFAGKYGSRIYGAIRDGIKRGH